jgi:hypothetical protein
MKLEKVNKSYSYQSTKGHPTHNKGARVITLLANMVRESASSKGQLGALEPENIKAQINSTTSDK